MPTGIGIGIRLPLAAQPRTLGGVGGIPPVNSVAPVISGTATEGSVLSCTTGTWSGSPTYAYQWKRGATNVGTNANTYTLVAGDIGSNMTCVVTATNAGGAASATSNSLGPVTAPVSALNPADKTADVTLSNANLTAEMTATANGNVRGTLGRSSGKYHFEALYILDVGGGSSGIGIFTSAFSISGNPRFASAAGFYAESGYVNENGVGGVTADGFTTGDTIAIEVDFGAAQFWVQKLGGTGRKGPFVYGGAGTYFPLVGMSNPLESYTVNFGATAFAITPTSGFSAWG